MNYFVTGIGTDVGKTLAAAVAVEALKGDYWKPVQSGLPRDTDTVKALVSNPTSKFHPEAFTLKTPASPHAAAAIDGVRLDLKQFQAPTTQNHMIIEGAGGAMVPLNHEECIIEMAPLFKAEILLVANYYLGSINHTLLTFELLKQRGYPIKGIIFNGTVNQQSKEVIMAHAWFPCLLEINQEPEVDQEVVKRYAAELLKNWN